MDLAELRKLVRLMEKAELSELEIDDSNAGLRVHLKRVIGFPGAGAHMGGAPTVMQVMSPGGSHAPSTGSGGHGLGAPSGASGSQEPGSAGAALPAGVEAIKSPMVGTFYRAANPDSDPFVERGTKVEDESVICIIEAMKVMNEIRAEMRGEIVEVLVENGEPVEFGQPLYLIKKA